MHLRLQHFGVTWIYLVQNGAVYKSNKLPMIDGMAFSDWLSHEHCKR